MARVLRPGGFLYLGTPNRHRIIGYLGSHDASAWDKFRWNLSDYRARLAGRFRNESGGHAGFTEPELMELLRSHFARIEIVSDGYFRQRYPNRLIATLLRRRWFRRFALPAIYVLCWSDDHPTGRTSSASATSQDGRA